MKKNTKLGLIELKISSFVMSENKKMLGGGKTKTGDACPDNTVGTDKTCDPVPTTGFYI